MRKVRRAAAMAVLLSLFVGLFPLAVSLPTATSASVVAQQQQDLDYLMETLEASHPDLYAHTEKAVFTRKADSIRQNLANMTDFDFAIELQSLVALAGDSHTMLSVGGLADQATFLPLSIQWMEGKWLLSVLPEGMEDRLGQQLVSVNGRSVEEIYEAVRPFYSYDNEIKLRRQFRQNFYLVPLLQHYGILGRDAQNATLVCQDGSGRQTAFQLPVVDGDALGQLSLCSLSQQRSQVPATEPDRDVLYKALLLDEQTAYIQYNACREDPELPMTEFVTQVDQLLDSSRCEKVLLDLRNNGGGSDGVLVPLLERLAQRGQQEGLQLYALIGEATFSSAVINGVMAKQVGFTLVGEATSGSVDHFGAVNSFPLPNLPVTVSYSTKYIDLGEYFAAAEPYGAGPLTPDIPVEQTLSDYEKGVDTLVEFLLQNEQRTYELPYYLRDGQPVYAGFSILQDGKMAYLLPAGVTVLYGTNPVSFADVQDHWAQQAIQFVASRQLLQGTAPGVFSPDEGMTRAMFVTVLGRLQQSATGEAMTPSGSFSDVPADAYYAPYVGWAAAQGIVTGKDAAHFAPKDTVTREEMAAMLARFCQATGRQLEPVQSPAHFTDQRSIHPWALEAVAAMQQAGVLQGDTQGRFSPQAPATRAETAITLQRLVEAVLASSTH